MSEHTGMSSPGEGDDGTIDQSESVSGGETTEAAEDQVSASFDGMTGNVEAVEGFVPKEVLGESTLAEDIVVTDAMASLPPVESFVFDVPETVCGTDDRVRISPATATPWRWCCQLLITLANGSTARGTGWFIGPRTVMTAGHCVFSSSAGGWARRIEVIPGMDATSRPFGSQVGTTFRSVTGWTQSANPEFDYGAIILPNGNLGNAVGWFGFASLSDASLQNLFVNTSGYPGDKAFGTQWFNAGTITQVSARRLNYMLDTFGGQSGSAVWRFQNGVRHAVGIHGYGGCPNKAVRITSDVYNNMTAWKNV